MDYSRIAQEEGGFENAFADSEPRNPLFGNSGESDGGAGRPLFADNNDHGGFGAPRQSIFGEDSQDTLTGGFGSRQDDMMDDGHGYHPDQEDYDYHPPPPVQAVASPQTPQTPFGHQEQYHPAAAQQQQQSYLPAEQHHEEQRPPQPQPEPTSPRSPQQQSRALGVPPQRKSRFYLHAKITALERQGRKDPSFRFDVHTNIPKFRTTQFRDVRRTHSEFQKLADHLTANNPECLVPQLPPPSTSAGVGTDEDEARVRGNMQRWLNYVTSSEYLIQDEELMIFIEGDSGYSPMVRKKPPATGVRRKVIKQFAPPPDDTPELYEARPIVKAFYLGTMETGQKVDKMVKNRRGLGLAEADLGVKLHNLSLLEGHAGMAHAYRKLGKTIQSVGDFHAAQATAEATTLGDPLQYHSQDAFNVKETLTNRHILIRELLQAQSALQSRETSVSRMTASQSIRKDKVDEAILLLDEAKQTATQLSTKVHRVTTNLVQERRKWFTRTSHDLRNAIRDYVIRQIEAERRALATLEGVRPDIRAIDASGGLSRLGRDVPPPHRRTSGPVASQGPRGDAWSGVQRSTSLNRSALVAGTGVIPGGVAAAGAGAVGEPGRRTSAGKGSGLGGVEEVNEDDDRIDAKNAASRLATSTF